MVRCVSLIEETLFSLSLSLFISFIFFNFFNLFIFLKLDFLGFLVLSCLS